MNIEQNDRARKFKKNTEGVGLQVLNIIAGLVKFAGEMAASKKEVYHSLYKSFGSDWTESKSARNLYELKRRGFIDYQSGTDDISIRFTNKAKIRTLETLGTRLEADGKNRFVSFDVPERMRSKRDQFRLALKHLGCQMIQSSLWVSNRNIGDLVEVAAYTFGIEEYVVYILAEKSDIDGLIDKKFS